MDDDTEMKLAAHVIRWLHKKNYEKVYQEVAYGGGTADLVVDRDGRGWVIECKKSLSMAVMGQAYDWQAEHAYVSVAVKKAQKRDSGRNFARAMCRHFGIGLIEVDRFGYAHEVVEPNDQRRKKNVIGDILQSCRPEHLDFCPAGSQHGAFTAFKGTIADVKKFLGTNGPADVATIVANVKHHYRCASAARRNLAKWLQDRKVCPGFEWRMVGNKLIFSLGRSSDDKRAG